jgi:hypothetical protein
MLFGNAGESSAKTSLVSRAAMTASRVRTLSAAVLVASLVSASGASAATFSIMNPGGTGTSIALPGSWNPSTNGATAGLLATDGIHVGTMITTFGTTNKPSDGLFVTPQNVILTFEFIGKEAGYTNDAALSYMGAALFTTASAFGTTTAGIPYDVLANPGLVPFGFDTSGGGTPAGAFNGGIIDSGLHIAFALGATANVAYAFFDDGGAGPDRDYDDMIVRIVAVNGEIGITPIPASLPLFAGGLGLIGLLSRRRKQKAAAAI